MENRFLLAKIKMLLSIALNFLESVKYLFLAIINMFMLLKVHLVIYIDFFRILLLVDSFLAIRINSS
jgi:hypothetical protein